MKNDSTIKSMLPNWWLSVLLCAFIFSVNAPSPSFNGQQRVPVKTEQRETVRTIRGSVVSFQKFCHATYQLCISENRFLLSMLSCSSNIQVKIRNQSKQILRFKPITFCWAHMISPRLSLDILLS